MNQKYFIFYKVWEAENFGINLQFSKYFEFDFILLRRFLLIYTTANKNIGKFFCFLSKISSLKLYPFIPIINLFYCRNTILALGSFLDTFQKIADAATNTKGQ